MNDPLPVLAPRPLPAAHRVALRRELADIASGRRRPDRRRGGRRVYLATGLSAAVLATGGWVVYSRLGSAPVTDHSTARCYTRAEYSPGAHFPGTGVSMADHTAADGHEVKGQVRDALGLCADLFAQGFLQVGSTHIPVIANPGPGANRPIPPLVECVLPDGTAAVFPGTGNLCARLGLADVGGAPPR